VPTRLQAKRQGLLDQDKLRQRANNVILSNAIIRPEIVPIEWKKPEVEELLGYVAPTVEEVEELLAEQANNNFSASEVPLDSLTRSELWQLLTPEEKATTSWKQASKASILAIIQARPHS
jgi:hypothetical protein